MRILLFALGAPLFDKVTIRLSDKYYSGKEFVITTSGNEKGTSYVQQYSLNGQQLHEPRIPFSEIVKGWTFGYSEWGILQRIIIKNHRLNLIVFACEKVN